MSKLTVIHGDCLAKLRELPAESVQCCVTSPPYFGLRDYGHPGQLGLENTPEEFVAAIVGVFREVRRVLRKDGTLWLNLGDSYWTDSPVRKTSGEAFSATWDPTQTASRGGNRRSAAKHGDIKNKDLIGIPWMTAFALRADGWYLRSDIIWHKPNPMPESVTDRPTKAHEYIFLLSKSDRYFYDADAIAEPVSPSSIERWAQDIESQEGSHRVPGKTNGTMKAVGRKNVSPGKIMAAEPTKGGSTFGFTDTRNKRTVWTVTTQPFKGAHFATYPPELITPCILAGSRIGDMVLDPFGGSGTTGEVALGLSRDCTLIELNGEYLPLIAERTGTSEGHLALHT